MSFLADLLEGATIAPPQNPTVGVINFSKLKEVFEPGTLLRDPNLSLGLIISRALNYLFIIAGLILLAFLIMGGFQLMVGATDPKAKEGASKTITNAIVGFIILFVSYWLVQIIEVIFGIQILK